MSKIFITGGTGTLGHALAKRLHQENDLTIYSRDPLKQIQMKKLYPKINFVLGDVADYDRLYHAMVGHDIVIHAAAQKHIPQGETDVTDCISTNVDGSRNIVANALRAGIKQVVGISTDKAANPVNTYGATKLLMERMFVEANQYGLATFHLCRYGNVLGSNGSVVQVWRKQMKEGLLPTVTDPTMSRFWLTEDQAVDLVLLALESPPGSIVVPNAPAINMGQFAAHAGIDDFAVIGRRPGEKQHECLITTEEMPYTTHHDGYFLITQEYQGNYTTPFTSNKPYTELDWTTIAELL